MNDLMLHNPETRDVSKRSSPDISRQAQHTWPSPHFDFPFCSARLADVILLKRGLVV